MKIGIIGLAGVGKDTFGKYLGEQLGFPVKAFAEPLHDAAKAVFGDNALDREYKEFEMRFGSSGFNRLIQYHNRFLAEKGLSDVPNSPVLQRIFATTSLGREVLRGKLSPRQLMQLYGSEYWRNRQKDFFIRHLLDKYQDVVVTDVRFENEAREFDVLVIIKRKAVKPVAAHPSEDYAAKMSKLKAEETHILRIGSNRKETPCVVLSNNGLMSELQTKAETLAEVIKEDLQ